MAKQHLLSRLYCVFSAAHKANLKLSWAYDSYGSLFLFRRQLFDIFFFWQLQGGSRSLHYLWSRINSLDECSSV